MGLLLGLIPGANIISALWGAVIFPILKAIPWQVWVIIAVVIAFLWYGHHEKAKGYEVCQQEQVVKTNQEIARQQRAADDAVKAAQQREAEALTQAGKTQEALDAAVEEASKLKTANQVCLPSSITKQFGGTRRVR